MFAFVASSSGESLQRRVARTDLVEEHAELGDLLPWVVLGATSARRHPADPSRRHP
ncbi:hypothetical protein [Nostocoides sp. Soil756]|uniref:hypothetical protein n=1 Tax=Nostocoides sp. Soil756 TaxID=1736399 RepID=UPI0012FCA75C|nr:hypothetical protein [Tetrasphaera sp. Soil756]